MHGRRGGGGGRGTSGSSSRMQGMPKDDQMYPQKGDDDDNAQGSAAGDAAASSDDEVALAAPAEAVGVTGPSETEATQDDVGSSSSTTSGKPSPSDCSSDPSTANMTRVFPRKNKVYRAKKPKDMPR